MFYALFSKKGIKIVQQLTGQKRIKPWMGFVLFLVVVVLVIFVLDPVQEAWKVKGLIATEASFLVLAIAYALLFRIPFKEMFPVRRFSARDLFGSMLLVTGGTLFGLVSVAATGIIFPKALEGSDLQAIQNYVSGGTGYPLLMFAMAFMPAVCEEALHRGAIISNFRTIKKDWVIVLIMGLLFGINHLSVLRFVNTAVMGACLTYIVVKKNNLILSSLMHFMINFTSASISYFSGASSIQLTAERMRGALIVYLFLGLVAPFFIVIGLMLLNPQAHKNIRFVFAGIITAVMLISAFALMFTNPAAKVIAQTNISYTVESENIDSPPVSFTVGTEGEYTVDVVIMNASGSYSVRIENAQGDTVAGGLITSSAFKVYNRQIGLEPGEYRIYVVNGIGTKGEKPVINVQVTSN